MRNSRLLKILVLAIGAAASLPELSAQETLQGTLFTNQEQRDYLDYLRRDFLAKSQEAGFNIEASDIPDIPVDGATSPAGPSEYTLGGIMRRGDGRLTIWLNNQSLTEAELPQIARLVADGNALALRFTTANGTQLLRPGQTIEINSGTVQERYQRPKPEETSDVSASPSASAETDTIDDASDANAPQDSSIQVSDASDNQLSASKASDDTDQDSTDPSTLVDNLPAKILESREALESVIESLQAKRDSLSDAEGN